MAIGSARRLGPRWYNRLKALLGLPAQRRLARAALSLEGIRYWEGEYEKLTDADILRHANQLRGRARGGESLDKLLAETLGATCVVARRVLGLRPFDTQLVGGVVIHQGGLAEIATGEGKTLVAILPAVLNALPGRGVHVTTVNDYLAKRDAEWTRPVYRALGLSVGLLQMKMRDEERIQAYGCDITYGTASEFGFDFLRDKLRTIGRAARETAVPFWSPWTGSHKRQRPAVKVQRELNYAIVDEADNIFIDEGRTPLIIAGATRAASKEEQAVYLWADQLARDFIRDQHFLFDEKKQKLELTFEGKQRIRWSNPPYGTTGSAMDKLQEHVERALHAHYRFRRDQHYIVEKDKIVIIDEYTGRRMPDRHWTDGLHQAVEAKETVSINMPADHCARVTFQSFYRLYRKLSGMSGTAVQNWRELRRVYKICVVPVPTNRPVLRKQLPDRVFATEEAKFRAVVDAVAKMHQAGRPVLIGTRSVDKSERLSELLREIGLEHQVLNARQHETEAEIVAEAGQEGRITIATNMAGRGTDIKLGEGVAECGGLHVLGTERHDAMRIDRQLAGRAGRQGDPGSCQFFLSLEDELLEGLGDKKQAALQSYGRRNGDRECQHLVALFRKAQRRVEYRHWIQRLDLMMHEKQRQKTLKDLGADPYVD
ncbi:MAG: preprotein translocase subunit SecA [Gemmataceae bacterium]